MGIYFFPVLFLVTFFQTSFSCQLTSPQGLSFHTLETFPVDFEDDFSSPADVISEDDFFALLFDLQEIYEPVFDSLGLDFAIVGDWGEESMLAYSQTDSLNPNLRLVNISGAVARHPEMSFDSFALAVCHEIGHHLGGYPYNREGNTIEGQADYFASSKCFFELFGAFDNSYIEEYYIPETVELECRFTHINEKDQYTCMRSILAGIELSEFLYKMNSEAFGVHFKDKMPSIDDEDYFITQEHSDDPLYYPSVQCRLDTFKQGALCPKANLSFYGEDDYTRGWCTRVHQDHLGVRPLCWFNPDQANEDLAAIILFLNGSSDE